MTSIQDYWNAIPKVTKIHAVGAFGSTVSVKFGLLEPFKVIYFPKLVWEKFEVWRLFTNFFFIGDFSMSWIMTMMLLIRFGSAMENDPYKTSRAGGTADHLFSILFMSACLLVIGWALELYVLSGPLLFGLVYLWSKRNATSPVNVWGFTFTGSALPWVLMAFTVLTGGSPIPDICGLVSAHLYYFLVEVLPLKNGRQYLSTPEVLIAFSEYLNGTSVMPAGQASGRPGQHQWGQGNRLG